MRRSTPILTCFAPTSLTTRHFGWYHQESWKNDDCAAIAEHVPAEGHSFFRAPLGWRRGSERALVAGRWVLRDWRATTPWALAEAQLYHGKFLQVFLNVVAIGNSSALPKGEDLPVIPSTSAGLHGLQAGRFTLDEALAHLVSGVLILSRAHHVLVHVDGAWCAAASEFGPRKDVSAISSDWMLSGRKVFKTVELVSVTASTWQASSLGRDANTHLRYLEKKLEPRTSFLEKESPRFGIFSMLRPLLSFGRRRRRDS